MKKSTRAVLVAAAVGVAGAVGVLTKKPVPCFTRDGRGGTRSSVPVCAVMGTCAPPRVVKECPK